MVYVMEGTLSGQLNYEMAVRNGIIINRSTVAEPHWDVIDITCNPFIDRYNDNTLWGKWKLFPGYQFTADALIVVNSLELPIRLEFTFPGTNMECGVILHEWGVIEIKQERDSKGLPITRVNMTHSMLDALQEQYCELRSGTLKPIPAMNWAATSL